MSNLYIWVDDKNRNNLIRTIDNLARRHPDFKALLRDGDKIENTLNLLFPHGMPMEYLISNLSIDERPEENLDLAFRPVLGPGQPWPFPPGCSLVAKGFWKTGAPFSRFRIFSRLQMRLHRSMKKVFPWWFIRITPPYSLESKEPIMR